LLQTLAVIGREVPLALISEIVTRPQIERMLENLQSGEFIYEQAASGGVEYTFKHALTQEVAYNSVLTERRRMLHEHAGEAIETLFSNRLDDHITELAYHYSRSTNAAKALTYLKSAGELAVRQSANREAAVLFNSALEILERLPETPERDQQELDLLIELGPALMSTRGFAAAECEAVYRRASDLCRRIGETPRLYTVLWGQWMCRSVQARWDEALDLAQKLLAIANSTQDTELLVEAHHASWNMFTMRSDLAKSEFHVREGLALYNPERHGRLFSRFGGHDPGVCAYGHGSINLWLLGNSDQSLTRIREALGLAERLKQYHTTVRGRAAASWLFQLRRDGAAAAQHARVAVQLASEYGLPFWQAFANLMMGWSLSESGRESEGLALMRQALAQYRNTGSEEHYSYFLLLLADSFLRQGQADQSLDVLAEAETMFKSNGERFHEPEVYRLQAESLLRQRHSGHEAAERKLRAAISISKQQGAKAWELRATTSLARLLVRQSRCDEGRTMLAEIYNWFTEGFDTPDLKDARALLDELA
jgi:adenylate cyclase